MEIHCNRNRVGLQLSFVTSELNLGGTVASNGAILQTKKPGCLFQMLLVKFLFQVLYVFWIFLIILVGNQYISKCVLNFILFCCLQLLQHPLPNFFSVVCLRLAISFIFFSCCLFLMESHLKSDEEFTYNA